MSLCLLSLCAYFFTLLSSVFILVILIFIMNHFTHLGSSGDDIVSDDLRALALMTLFGTNIVFSASGVGGAADPDINFDLPYSLTNLTALKRSNVVGYNSQFQAVNEYSDKPYAKKGYLAVVFEPDAIAGTVAKDMDNFVRFGMADTGGSALAGLVYIGIVNSSQTDFYEPLSAATLIKVFYALPAHLQGFASPSQLAAAQAGQLPIINPNASSITGLFQPPPSSAILPPAQSFNRR